MSCINEAYKISCWTDEFNKSENTKSIKKSESLSISFSKFII